MNNRVPPHSEEAERAVLGSIMLNDKTLDIVRDYKLTPDAFYVPAHRTIFDAILEAEASRRIVDSLMIAEHLSQNGNLDSVGGFLFLDRLIDDTPTATHAEYYIQIVADKWKLRSIIEECRSTEQLCYEDSDDTDALFSGHASRLMQLEDRHVQQEVTWSKTVQESMAAVEQIMNAGTSLSGFSTGFLNIDRAVLGLRKGELTIVAARPSMGKTSLSMNIAEYVASGKTDPKRVQRPVGIFSLEMGRHQLALRMKCSHAGVNNWKLMRGFVSKNQLAQLVQSAAELATLPLHVDDRAGLDIDQIRIKTRRWKDRHGIQLLIVDYLQLVRCKKKEKQGRYVEVSTVSAELKELAKDADIPVLALAQLSRKTEDRKEGRPMLSDLKDSGALEQDADNVWLLHRPCKYEGHPEHDDASLAILDIAKQRNGPTGEARLNFLDELTRFEDRRQDADNPTTPL